MLRIISIFAALLFSGCSPSADRLDNIDRELQNSFPNIGHVSAEKLSQWQSAGKEVLLIDVREEDEFAVSHLEGALRIDPKASASEVAAIIGDAKGKDVIFYCSVGVRSSQLADRAKDSLQQLGAGDIYNLRGGIFAWHNDERPLISDTGDTQMVHAYNGVWGKLVTRQDYVSYTP